MAKRVGNEVVEQVLEKTVENLSPSKKIFAVIKKVITTFIFLKWIGVIFLAWFNNVRRATIISAMDKYPENKVWKTILWIKTWRLIYGIIIGLLLAYYYATDDLLMKFIDYLIDLVN